MAKPNRMFKKCFIFNLFLLLIIKMLKHIVEGISYIMNNVHCTSDISNYKIMNSDCVYIVSNIF